MILVSDIPKPISGFSISELTEELKKREWIETEKIKEGCFLSVRKTENLLTASHSGPATVLIIPDELLEKR